MKIYFSATITKDKKHKTIYDKIVDFLEGEGHTVLTYQSHQLDPKTLINRSDNEIRDTYKELDKFLKNADLYIADISLPSVGIGYEISQAIALKKPALVLNHESTEFQPLATIEGNKSKLLSYETYNKDNIEKKIGSFVKESKKKIDTKFILILSAELDRYITWVASNRRMHKAQVVRNALNKELKKDKEYLEQAE